MKSKNINIPPELSQAIRTDELIVFVGAGLSYNLKNIKNEKIKGWENLVSNILTHLKKNDYDVDYLIPLIGNCEPIKILDLIESDKNLSKNEIMSFIKEFFDIQKDNDFSLHKSLFQLSRKIITTNYDTAFELSNSELRKNTAYKGKNYELTKHKDTKSPLLFKLHGCYENADSMVLFPSDYKELYNNPNKDAEHSLLVLKNIVFNKTVLFVGCGLGDFQINNIFSEIKTIHGDYSQKHFIITKQPLESSLNFLTPIIINDYSKIKQFIVYLLKEKEKIYNQKMPDIQSLENQLDETQKKLVESEKKIRALKMRGNEIMNC